MPKKAKPILRIEAYIVKDDPFPGYRVLFWSRLTYKGKAVNIPTLPIVDLAKSPTGSCVFPLDKLHFHNGHASIYQFIPEAESYVSEVVRRIRRAIRKSNMPLSLDIDLKGKDKMVPWADKVCGEHDPSSVWICTKRKGHDGHHVAHAGSDTVINVWD